MTKAVPARRPSPSCSPPRSWPPEPRRPRRSAGRLPPSRRHAHRCQQGWHRRRSTNGRPASRHCSSASTPTGTASLPGRNVRAHAVRGQQRAAERSRGGRQSAYFQRLDTDKDGSSRSSSWPRATATSPVATSTGTAASIPPSAARRAAQARRAEAQSRRKGRRSPAAVLRRALRCFRPTGRRRTAPGLALEARSCTACTG